MTQSEYEIARRKASGTYEEWRKARSARQRQRVAERRERDPEWWQDYLRRNAEYRRNKRRQK